MLLRFNQILYKLKSFIIKLVLALIPSKKGRYSIRLFLHHFNLCFWDVFKTPHFAYPFLLPSKEKWKKLKNKFSGERCFIVGSAPSVKNLDLSLLNNEYTFTCNNGFKLKECGLEKSSFYCIADGQFYRENEDNIDLEFADYFFVSDRVPWKLNCENSFVFQSSGAMMKDSHFQTDLEKPLAMGWTVVLKMMQIAYYLGFNEIYLIGVDMDYNKSASSYFYKPSKAEQERIDDTAKKINTILDGIAYGAEFLTRNGVVIKNASPSGIVDSMERVNYNSLFTCDDKISPCKQ